MTADDLTALNEQIAGMARAGLPLDQGLASLARDMGRGRLRTVTETLARDLRAGHPLPEALERQKGRVPPYYANLVLAGVQTGRLPEVLATLTAYARSVATTRAIVIESLFYPAVVLFIGLVLFLGLALVILPQFDQIFADFGLKLPLLTEIVLAFGRHPLELVVLPLLVIAGGLLLAWVLSRVTAAGRRVATRAVYLVPVVGSLIRSARLAAFTDLLALMIEYGVPLPAAFRLAGAASTDPVMAARAEQIHDKLTQGVPLGEAVRGRGLVAEWVAWLAEAGQARSGLAPALRQIAAVYRRQADTRAAFLRNVLPAFVVIVTAGFLIGVFALSLMLPMVKLLEGLSQ